MSSEHQVDLNRVEEIARAAVKRADDYPHHFRRPATITIEATDAMAMVAAIRAMSVPSIPAAQRQSLDSYAQHGLPPGHCLRAVLAGDLFSAFSRADPEVQAAMPAIVAHVRNNLPGGSWGSYEIVDRWIARPRS